MAAVRTPPAIPTGREPIDRLLVLLEMARQRRDRVAELFLEQRIRKAER